MRGLAVVDIDGDNELVAGTAIYRRLDSWADRDQSASGSLAGNGNESPDLTTGWTREDIATGWDYTRVAVGDLDDDSDPEVVFAESDSSTYGEHIGRVGWFDPLDWEPHILDDDLYCPHTVQLADFVGNGSSDIYVAKMGRNENEELARHVLFHNQGDGKFDKEIVELGFRRMRRGLSMSVETVDRTSSENHTRRIITLTSGTTGRDRFSVVRRRVYSTRTSSYGGSTRASNLRRDSTRTAETPFHRSPPDTVTAAIRYITSF